MAKYYTLLTKDAKGDDWSIQFGDYDREVVEDEKVDSYSDCYTKIICTHADQQSINDAVANLNKKG